MNIAFFMTPKAESAFLYDDYTMRQALERMHHHGYSAVPVLDREGHYVGTLSEGDFLWFIVKGEGGEPHTMAIEELEKFKIKQLNISADRNPPIKISASMDDLLNRALAQNFIPIVDDRGSYIGLVTRQAVIRYFYEK